MSGHAPDRYRRFGDPTEYEDREGLHSFLTAEEAKARMNEVRDWIVRVRHPQPGTWAQAYPEFAGWVRRRVAEWREAVREEDARRPPTDEASSGHSKRTTVDRPEDSLQFFDRVLGEILGKPRRWADVEAQGGGVDREYKTLQLYSSDYGYRILFRNVKRILRQKETPSETDRLLAAFVVELVNIDLYNKWLFEGVEFRGVSQRRVWLTESHVGTYKDLMTEPLGKRDPSLPLALDSSTVGGEEFGAHYVSNSSSLPAILRVHVHELGGESLAYYHANHRRLYAGGNAPAEGVVSPICAFPIQDVSLHRDEQEVLLRGPFFQLLRVSRGDVGGGETGPILDVVCLSANRDHPTTPQDPEGSGAEEPARDLFTRLILKRRMECTRDYYAKLAYRTGRKGDDELAAEAEAQCSLAEDATREQAERLRAFAAAKGLPQPRF